MSKLDNTLLETSIAQLLAFSNGEKISVRKGKVTEEVQGKKRNFVETIELQVTIKNHDPKKDKRFSGTFQLPLAARPNLKVCVLGNEIHYTAAKEAGIETRNVEDLKKFNRNKKEVKRRLVSKFDVFMASSTLLKKIPRLMGGPVLQRANKFPVMISPSDNLVTKVDTVKRTIKWQLKKVFCLNASVANVSMTPEEIKTQIVMAVNFLVSLQKKNWQNIKVVYIKSTMGPSFCLYL
eukprot:CAMPEP_0197657876 /NCGR_PEP_ID=MMETSP1338-20131121/44897_1 /TAXON_ID=43686 ORGANISM="Pelagodinium beii, Strain RCC1491" /NCGR_SAMPLE_ID=MMETSP1338 /ASSEMBLY_ACC=CAM_ASM_000754 /LENGTH=235 /DNA_ID=CAMNT_0043234345 /DNA_START=49 /DNA_END=756 /DNA_ORIENTATION=-